MGNIALSSLSCCRTNINWGMLLFLQLLFLVFVVFSVHGVFLVMYMLSCRRSS